MTDDVGASTGLPLAGISILVTRPLHQAERTAQAIAAAGGEAIIFPTIAIEPLRDDSALHDLGERMTGYDMAIFVSANAVERGLAYLPSSWQVPPGMIIAAVGEATKKAMREHAIAVVLAPEERHDSEALLALAPMRQVSGKRIVIFRGEGGREFLADSLRARGAQVFHAACYRRVRPEHDASFLRSRWRTGNIAAVSALSLESLLNLYHMLDAEMQALLVSTPVLVPHPRVAEAAAARGFSDVRVTGTGDDALIESLLSCRKQ